MSNLQHFVHQISPVLESANFQVRNHEGQFLIQGPGHPDLTLRLDFQTSDQADAPLAKFSIPLDFEIPDQQWLNAAHIIDDFNRSAPLGVCALDGISSPAFDYHLPISLQGEFLLNLVEAVQMSFVAAWHLLSLLRQKLFPNTLFYPPLAETGP